MKTTLRYPSILSLQVATVLAAIGFSPLVRAGVNLYPVDGNTLHLWHMQELSGTINYDSVSNQNAQTLNIDLTNTPGPNAISTFAGIYPTTNFVLMDQPGPDATLANPSLAFTNSITTAKYACDFVPWQVFPPTNYNDFPINLYFTNVANYCNTNTGAWCQECLIQPQVNLATYAVESSQSLSGGDGPGSYLLALRGWQFRIDYNGGKPTLEFNNVAEGGTNHDLFGFLPTVGPDAIAVAPPWPWYHVAVAYTGSAPTNGDPANVFTMYWTLLDPTRTNGSADILTNIQNAFTLTNSAANSANMLNWKANTLTTWLYPSNSLLGDINLTIGGNGRGNVTNSVAGAAGFLGSMAEYRISMSYRHTNEFVFNTSPTLSPPIVLGAPMTNVQYVPFGGALVIAPVEIVSPPFTNQWYQIVNGVTNLLAGQTNLDLVISNVSYSQDGNYELVVGNALGTSNSALGLVDVLPAVEGLFNTGCGPQNNPLDQTAPGSVDQHWLLPVDPDTSATIPDAIVWSDGGPLEPAGVGPPNAASVWIGPHENGPSINKVAGVYTYETSFQVDESVVSNTVISGNLGLLTATNKEVVQMILNGMTNNITMTLANPAEGVQPFTLTNGLQAGSNTLLITSWQSGSGTAGENALNVLILTDTGMPLTNAPVITNAPVGVTNVYGAAVSFSAVALGAGPMFYYWLSNSVPITPPTWIGTTLPYLSFVATNFNGSQLVGTNYFANIQIVFSNYVGVVTSAVAKLDIQLPPLTLASAGVPIWNPSTSETNIVVYFSGGVDPATATAAANYSLNNGASVYSAVLGGASNEVVLTTSVLNPATSYTLTAQNVNSSFGFVMNPSPQSLAVGTYPNVAFWYKATAGVIPDSTGTNVTEWDDQSGNGNDLIAPFGPPFDPILVTNASGYPVITFDATNETILEANDSASIGQTSNLTIFAVMNFGTLQGGTNGDILSKATANFPSPYDYYVNSSSVVLLRGNGSAAQSVASTRTPSLGATHLLDVVMQGWNVTHRLDGQPNGSGVMTPIAITDDTTEPLSLGTRDDGHNRLTGGINELVLIGSALSSSDVASMESYLNAEYSLQPPVNANPTNVVFSLANNQLTLSWPADHTGWQLQVQTNSLAVGISTNWVNVAGSTTTNQVIVPLNLTNGSVFYRLMYQP
ncbi:MAG TPA: LamG-like jellyroll fold domain-containing protein [Alphaproteobacteria bacterium]|nr:LamG-like jellyroll fold domain-containing protein [Alphaproteobacteria bacterium]